MDDDLRDAETTLLRALLHDDLDAVGALLAPDFIITTAGWIAEPVGRSAWLEGLREHHLLEFDIRLLAVRRSGDVAVVLAESTQHGTRAGQPWAHTFRYTDVWFHRGGGWLLAVRHASAAPRA